MATNLSTVNLYRTVQCSAYSEISNYPHYGMPSYNLHKQANLASHEDFSNGFPYSCHLPLPFLPPEKSSKEVSRGEDPVLKLVKEKFRWERSVQWHLQDFKTKAKIRHFSNVLEELITSGRNGNKRVPCKYANFTDLVYSDPDEDFQGIYNWYYAGGSLNHFKINSETILIKTEGKLNDELSVIPLTKKKNRWKSLTDKRVKSSCNDRIYQISAVSKENEGYIGARLHNKCQLHVLSSDFSFRKAAEISSKYTFLGLDMDKYSIGTYCTVTTKGQVEEWNAESSKHISSAVFEKEDITDNWYSVLYLNEPYNVLLTKRRQAIFLDKRKRLMVPGLALCPKEECNVLEECEDLTLSFKSSLLPYGVYIGTTHQLLLYDIRSPSNVLQRWTHLLSQPPLYGSSVLTEDGKELLCIANQEPCEIVSIYNMCDNDVPNCQVLPLVVPNLHNAQISANKHGLWLDPSLSRLRLSLTGITLLPSHMSEPSLLSQTSAGDVFHNIFKARDMNRKENSKMEAFVTDYSDISDLKCLKKWEKQVHKLKQVSRLEITKELPIKDLYNKLRWSKSKYEVGKTNFLIKDKKPITRGGGWRMSKADMQRYVDILAPRMLEVWDIDEDPEWYATKKNRIRKIRGQSEKSLTYHDKVRDWLNNTDKDTESSSFSDESDLGSPIQEKSERIIENSFTEKLQENNMKNRKKQYIIQEKSERIIENSFTEKLQENNMKNRKKQYIISTPNSHLTNDEEMYSQDIFITQKENTTRKRILNNDENQIDDDCIMVSETVNAKRIKMNKSYKSKHVSGF